MVGRAIPGIATLLTAPRYQPPEKGVDKPSIDNSQDTALFLVSCFQYILSGVVLSVGAPFRKSMTANGMSIPLLQDVQMLT
jgi:cation-transporting P-type ATPase 13A2